MRLYQGDFAGEQWRILINEIEEGRKEEREIKELKHKLYQIGNTLIINTIIIAVVVVVVVVVVNRTLFTSSQSKLPPLTRLPHPPTLDFSLYMSNYYWSKSVGASTKNSCSCTVTEGEAECLQTRKPLLKIPSVGDLSRKRLSLLLLLLFPSHHPPHPPPSTPPPALPSRSPKRTGVTLFLRFCCFLWINCVYLLAPICIRWINSDVLTYRKTHSVATLNVRSYHNDLCDLHSTNKTGLASGTRIILLQFLFSFCCCCFFGVSRAKENDLCTYYTQYSGQLCQK